MGWSAADQGFMELAFSEAEKVKGKTLPNPAVGAALVKNGKVIGKGGTQTAGKAHAEIVALEEAGAESTGATLYVTLEPCCHHGKTPPCTRAIIGAGVKKVVAACADSNFRMKGKGFLELKEAGIEVKVGLLEERARSFYEEFFFYIQHGRPKIVVKIAQSIDGRINSRPGVETKITGIESRKFCHALRAKVDAILIGGETLRVDNPDLSPRLSKGSPSEALILTRRGRLDSGHRLFSSHRASLTLVLSPRKSRVQGLPSCVEQVYLPSSTGSSAPESDRGLAAGLLKVFLQRGYHSVLVEGGRSVWTPFLNAGLCDELYLFTGPMLLPKGERWDENLGSQWVKTLDFHRFTPSGSDFLTEYRNVHRHRTRIG